MTRVRRVERDHRWGWIARTKDGRELGCGIEDGFRWRTRDVAWAVAREHDHFEAIRSLKRPAQKQEQS